MTVVVVAGVILVVVVLVAGVRMRVWLCHLLRIIVALGNAATGSIWQRSAMTSGRRSHLPIWGHLTFKQVREVI